MSAVWRASRAAVRRRRMQTFVIGVVVGLSALLSVVALGLLAASSGPFDQAYAKLRGAHLVASFDASRTTAAQLAAAARQPGVDAVAGPFEQAILQSEHAVGGDAMTVVGRADPGGPVDRLNVWQGRWATAPGEIVLAGNPADGPLPMVGHPMDLGGTPLTVVGIAFSVSGSANAWVTPAELATRHPVGLQMLYRFAHATTAIQMTADQSLVTAGLPLVGSQSYLTLRAKAAAEPATFVPFLIVFGLLGLAVAVLIVANVVSGAVVAGFRHIGVLKAIGFTPGQVLGVYLSMVSIPAIAGTLIGTTVATFLTNALLSNAFKYWGLTDVYVAWWVDAAVLVGMPVLVALSALVPALRARSLPAARAISAGSTQSRGRAPRIQRRFGGTRLPRAVSLGLGLPFARPGRSLMTLAAVLLGVTSVTFAIGLAASVTRYANADPDRGIQADVHPHSSGTAIGHLLAGLPGTAKVIASANLDLLPAGTTEDVQVRFFADDAARGQYRILRGHWFDGPGQVAVSRRFLEEQGLALGDTFTLQLAGHGTPVRIVAEWMVSSSETIFSNAATLARVAPGTDSDLFQVELTPGTSVNAYLAKVTAADPDVDVSPAEGPDSFIILIVATVTLLTLLLGAVAALGVFNTVVLNTRERRRDLGMLKSIGMTPGQVSTMLVTSMAALGALSGLAGIPLGIGAQHLVVPAMGRSAQVVFPSSMVHVYSLPLIALLALAGVAIAALGAYLPARSAGRATIAAVLHNE